jgi:hypothetical protein
MEKEFIVNVDKIIKTTEAKNGQTLNCMEMKEISPKSNQLGLTLSQITLNMYKSLSKYDYTDVVNIIIDIFDGLICNKKREIVFSVDISDLTDITTIRKLTSAVLAAGNLVAVESRFGIANVILLNSKVANVLKDKIPETEFIIVESLEDRLYLYRRNNLLDLPNILFCYDPNSNLCDIVKVGDITKQVEVVYLNNQIDNK